MFGGGIKGKNLSTDVSKWNNGGWLQLHDNIIKSTIHISRMSLHGYRILQTQDILIPKTIHETPWTQCQSVLRRGGSQVTDSYLTDSHLTETDWLDRLSTGRLLRWLHLTDFLLHLTDNLTNTKSRAWYHVLVMALLGLLALFEVYDDCFWSHLLNHYRDGV